MQVKQLLVLLVVLLVSNKLNAQNVPVDQQPSSQIACCYFFLVADGNITTDECLWGDGGGPDFLDYLNFFPGAYYQTPEPQDCYTYNNFCFDDSFKRQTADNVQSILFDVGGFGSDAIMEDDVEQFLQDVQNGVFEDDNLEVFNCELIDCTLLQGNANNDFCPNQCNDCAIAGEWHDQRSGPCAEQFSNCPSGDSNLQTRVRTVYEYTGTETLGETDQPFTITQFWQWDNEDGRCTGTWDASFRFYSTASQCRLNVFNIDEDDCTTSCDSSVSSGLRNLVCDRDNLLLENEIDLIVFTDDCDTYTYQNNAYDSGAGSDDFDPSISDTSIYPIASAGSVLTAGVVGVIVGVFGVLF